MSRIGVIGAGSFGTALAVTLSRKGYDVNMYTHNSSHLAAMEQDRENRKYLPGVTFPEKLTVTGSEEEALDGAEIALFSVPAQAFRGVLGECLPYLKEDMLVVNVAKGIEKKTLLRMSEIAAEQGIRDRYVVFSGPSHAEEVGACLPTTVIAASENEKAALKVQDMFSTEFLRIYTSSDICGVELGGALKNIIALGAGISDGMGFGDNAKAAMMTRGIAEMKRLGAKLGAEEATFAGLAGIGDLIVTCTSMHSRNRRCGIMIGEGMKPEEAVAKVGMVVEGMFTAEAAYELAKKAEVEMPITNALYRLVQGEIDGKEAVLSLMSREQKPED